MDQEATKASGEDTKDLDLEIPGQSTDYRTCAATTAEGLDTTQEPVPYAAGTLVGILEIGVINGRGTSRSLGERTKGNAPKGPRIGYAPNNNWAMGNGSWAVAESGSAGNQRRL